MIGVIAKNKDGIEESMSIQQWQEAEKLGYTFVKTYTEKSPPEGAQKTYIQPISSSQPAKAPKKKGCGCGK
jgi:hypothetical protein